MDQLIQTREGKGLGAEEQGISFKWGERGEAPILSFWEIWGISFLFSTVMLKSWQRLGVPRVLQTAWQGSDTGSQSGTGSPIVPRTRCSLAFCPEGALEPGVCEPGMIRENKIRLCAMERGPHKGHMGVYPKYMGV